MDIDRSDFIRATGVASVGDSGTKLDDTLPELWDWVAQAREDSHKKCYDSISGGLLGQDLSKEARKVEMETFRKRDVCATRKTRETESTDVDWQSRRLRRTRERIC